MKLFIEIPTWLGDAVMATPAIDNLIQAHPEARLTIMGSFVSSKLFLHHPNVERLIIDDSRKRGFRYANLYKLAKQAGSGFDYALSFRKHFTTKFLLRFIDARQKFHYRRFTQDRTIHTVVHYNAFVNWALQIDSEPGPLSIRLAPDTAPKTGSRPKLGINPGATYGSAKRWYPEEFAKVAIALADRYDITIFGGPGEVDIAANIEQELQKGGISNYRNLAGKSSVEALISEIAGLDLFITNDSGPLHVSAAFQIPTVAIFGPTRHIETHQWMNEREMLIRKEIECAPCMRRTCPLKHHNCMKLITAEDVLRRLEVEGYLKGSSQTL